MGPAKISATFLADFPRNYLSKLWRVRRVLAGFGGFLPSEILFCRPPDIQKWRINSRSGGVETHVHLPISETGKSQ